MKKRVIALFTAAVVACTTISASASTIYSHEDEFWSGKYLDNKQKNLCFFVRKSAQTSILTKDIYNPSAWNDVSENVHVSVEFETDENSGLVNFRNAFVLGVTSYAFGGRTVRAETCPYDQYGRPIPMNELDRDWLQIDILMNTDEKVYSEKLYSGLKDKSVVAKKTFLHEVGHSLKLQHPVENSALEEHIFSGLPLSVMNNRRPYSQGGEIFTASEPTHHDRVTLIAKWGDEVV